VVARKLDELDAPAKKAFQKQFANQGDEVLAKFNQGDGELVDAWGVIKFSGDDDLAKLANNLNELDLVAKNVDKIEAVGGYKAWKTSSAYTNFGKTIKGGKNLLDIDPPTGEFSQLISKDGKTHRAATFWKQESINFLHHLSNDGKFYLKYDPSSGKAIVVDTKTNEFRGFFLDEGFGSNSKHFSESQVEELMESTRFILGESGTSSIVLGGKTINLSRNKTNVLIGSFWNGAKPSNTSEALEKLKYLTNADFKHRPGGIQLLNVPDEMYRRSSDFWQKYNLPWLNKMADLDGVEFIILSDITDIGLLYRSGELSGFGRELTTMLKNTNFDLWYDEALGMHKFVKKGSKSLPQARFDEQTLLNHLKGEISRRNAVGGHIPKYIDGENVRYKNGVTSQSSFTKDINGVYEAEIEIKRYLKNPDGSIQLNADGTEKFVWELKKTAKSTFFPADWSDIKIIDEIKFSFSNRKIINLSEGIWEGVTREGIIIRGALRPDGTIKTAFPIIVI